jgi:hypothetical protein
VARRRASQNATVRLWTLHPKYLDARGLVALWREGLLAQAVLATGTRGYRRHPQLERFRAAPNPGGAIAAFLRGVAEEGARRGYAFDAGRIGTHPARVRLPATRGQLAWELGHLRKKLWRRDRAAHGRLPAGRLRAHPLFAVRPGPVEPWEVRR